MNDIKKEAIKEFKEKFFQLPGVKERDFINKYIDKATLAEQKRLNGLAELATLAQKKKDAEIVNKMCQEAERRDTTISAWLWLDTARKAILNQLELLDSIR